MTHNMYVFVGILLLSLLVIVTRIIPFIFSKQLKESQTIQIISQHLPASILLLLVIYEIHPEKMATPPHGLYELLGLAAVTLIHLWKRNLILSVLLGTACYVFMKYYFPLYW